MTVIGYDHCFFGMEDWVWGCPFPRPQSASLYAEIVELGDAPQTLVMRPNFFTVSF